MQQMPEYLAISSCCTIASLVMACWTLVTSTSRLCTPFLNHVFGSHQFSLKMDWSFSSKFSNIQDHYPTSENCICPVWNSRHHCNGQWNLFHKRRVQRIFDKERHLTQNISTIPSSHKQAGRTGSSNPETRFQEEHWRFLVRQNCKAYRRTPHSTTGMTPAQLLIGRIPGPVETGHLTESWD